MGGAGVGTTEKKGTIKKEKKELKRSQKRTKKKEWGSPRKKNNSGW